MTAWNKVRADGGAPARLAGPGGVARRYNGRRAPHLGVPRAAELVRPYLTAAANPLAAFADGDWGEVARCNRAHARLRATAQFLPVLIEA
jgi:hypothetical protein